jgi:hypothetical protein
MSIQSTHKRDYHLARPGVLSVRLTKKNKRKILSGYDSAIVRKHANAHTNINDNIIAESIIHTTSQDCTHFERNSVY